MIGLDWDSIAYYEARKRIDDIIKNDFVDYIDLFESPSGEGYHVKVYTKQYFPYTKRLQLRQSWKDDGKRIVTDLLKSNQAPKEVLFYKKSYGKYDQVEIFIEKIRA